MTMKMCEVQGANRRANVRAKQACECCRNQCAGRSACINQGLVNTVRDKSKGASSVPVKGHSQVCHRNQRQRPLAPSANIAGVVQTSELTHLCRLIEVIYEPKGSRSA